MATPGSHSAFFLVSLLLHWYFGWQAFVAEAAEHGQAAQDGRISRLRCCATHSRIGSPSSCSCCGRSADWPISSTSARLRSKENDDRVEAKIDALLIMKGNVGFEIMEKLDRHFLRAHGHRATVWP